MTTHTVSVPKNGSKAGPLCALAVVVTLKSTRRQTVGSHDRSSLTSAE